MGQPRSKVTIHMVSSLDGFISKEDNSVSWMHSTDSYEKGVALTDEMVSAFLEKIDCYVMGSKTYEHALAMGWPYGEIPVVVVSSRTLRSDRNSVTFFSGDLDTLVNKQLKPKYNNIWMVGGAQLTKSLLRAGLANEIVMTIMPVLLGNGTLFFDYIGLEQPLHLEDVTAYKDGMVELTYSLNKQ